MSSMEKKFAYFPAAWYPILHSKELATGEKKVVKAFAGEIVLFRGESGKVGATLPHCPHMGTHFRAGKICGEHLTCPLHLRQYDMEGKCVHVPGSKDIPKGSDVRHLPVHEEVGILFIFLGKDVGFSFPLNS